MASISSTEFGKQNVHTHPNGETWLFSLLYILTFSTTLIICHSSHPTEPHPSNLLWVTWAGEDWPTWVFFFLVAWTLHLCLGYIWPLFSLSDHHYGKTRATLWFISADKLFTWFISLMLLSHWSISCWKCVGTPSLKPSHHPWQWFSGAVNVSLHQFEKCVNLLAFIFVHQHKSLSLCWFCSCMSHCDAIFWDVAKELTINNDVSPILKSAYSSFEKQDLDYGRLWLRNRSSVLLMKDHWFHSSGLQDNMSLGKILNPKLLLMCWWAPCMHACMSYCKSHRTKASAKCPKCKCQHVRM